jgi:hypothetical protein
MNSAISTAKTGYQRSASPWLTIRGIKPKIRTATMRVGEGSLSDVSCHESQFKTRIWQSPSATQLIARLHSRIPGSEKPSCRSA